MHTLTDAQFEDAVRSPSLTLIELSAPWCTACKALAPTVEALSDKVQVYMVDVDRSGDRPGLDRLYRH